MKYLVKIQILIFFTFLSMNAIEFEKAASTQLELPSLPGYDAEYNEFYRLTPNGQFQRGGLWSKQTVDLSQPFLIEFEANFGKDNLGADGIAFLFHKDPLVALFGLEYIVGGFGQGIGYGDIFSTPIFNSLALEFDTFENSPNTDYYGDDISADHFDIRRNGLMTQDNGFVKKVFTDCNDNTINIENGKRIPVQILWFPGQPASNPIDNTVGTLIVYFNCKLLYFEDEFDIDYNLGWSNLQDVYFGLTASTGERQNFHRVKLSSPDLELVQDTLCSTIQLEAKFPDLCGSVKYNWKASDGSQNGLINPNSKKPIATLSDTYTCEVSIEGTDYEWYSILNNPLISESISVVVPDNIPEFSFRKSYSQKFIIDNNLVSSGGQICGAVAAEQDCGYLISAWSDLKTKNISGISSGTGAYLIRTDYYGNLLWDTYFVNGGIDVNTNEAIDFLNLTQHQKEYFRFYTTYHNAINSYKRYTNTTTNCETEYSETGVLNDGFILTGETRDYFSTNQSDNLLNGEIDILLTKVNMYGEIISSAIFSAGTNAISNKSIYHDNSKLITQCGYVNRTFILGLDIPTSGTNEDKFILEKKIEFLKNSSTLNVTHSDIISIPIGSTNNIEDNFRHIFVNKNNNFIEILLLDDIFKINLSNLKLASKKINTINSSGLRDHVRIIYNKLLPNKFYLVTEYQISSFTLNSTFDDFTLDYTYEIDLNFNSNKINYLSNAKLDFTNNEIEILVFRDFELCLLRFDLSNNSISGVKYLNAGWTDNLNLNVKGAVFAGGHSNGVELTYHNDNNNDCSEPLNVSLINHTPNLLPSTDITLVEPNITEKTSYLTEVPSIVLDKGYHCNTVDDCDCNDINENTFELYYEKLPRSEYDSECCYKVYIKNNSDCLLSDFDLLIQQSEINLSSNLPSPFNISGLYPLESILIGEICVPFGEESVTIDIKFSKDNEICKDVNQQEIVLSEELTCIEPCCDDIDIKFLFNNQYDGKCRWSPFIDNGGNPTCDYKSIEVKYYYSHNNQEIILEDGFIVVGQGTADFDIYYELIVDGMICDVESTTLSCFGCDCPFENVKSKWITVTSEKNTVTCPGNYCDVSAYFEIEPLYKDCFYYYIFEYQIVDKDGTINPPVRGNRNSVMPYHNAINLYSGCLEAGAKIQFKVELYSSITDTSACVVTSQVITCEEYSSAERPDACDIPGYNDAWNGSGQVDITVNGCKYTVHYQYRKTLDEHQDVQLTSITKNDENCDDSGTPNELIFQKALPKAIKQIVRDRAEFEPQPDQNIKCRDTWRVIQESCWAEYFAFNLDDFYSVLIPCTSECCARHLRVCYEDGELQITELGFAAGSSNYNCSQAGVPTGTIPDNAVNNPDCQDLNCDIFEDLVDHEPYNIKDENEIIYNNGGLTGKLYKNNIREVGDTFMVYSFSNSNDMLKIYVEKTSFEKIILEIYDLNGSKVKSVNVNNLNNDIYINVELNDLNNGTYVFSFTNGSIIFSTNKFQIVR